MNQMSQMSRRGQRSQEAILVRHALQEHVPNLHSQHHASERSKRSPRVAALRSLAVLGAILVAGCATVPPYLEDWQAHPHPDCDPNISLGAIGSSEKGELEAEEIARARLVKQIQSEIKVATRRVMTLVKNSTNASVNTAIEEKITSNSSFRHAHLIKRVGKPATVDGRTRVLVCLDSKAAAEALQSDLRDDGAVFYDAEKRATEASKNGDDPSFTVAYAQARQKVPAILQGFTQLRAVKADTSGDEERLQKAWEQLQAEAARIRSAKVVLDWKSGALGDAGSDERISGVFQRALSKIGLSTSVGSGGCNDNLSTRFVMQVAPDLSCKFSPLGVYMCKLAFVTKTLRCTPSGEEVAFDATIFPGKGMIGQHREEAFARSRAISRLTESAMAPGIKESFRGQLPFE